MSSLPTTSTATQAESLDYRSVAIDDIIVKQRHRKDPGDIGKLAASMGDLGQLQPVLLDTHLNLIAGERRLLAAQKLGWERVDAHVVHNFDDAAKCLRAERDENICRKEMSVVELASLADHLLEIEKAAAKERQRKHGGTAPGKNTPEEIPEVSGKAIDRVAEAVGVSAPTLRGVQKIADAAVPELVELVDKGEVKIAPAAEVASLPAEEQKAIVKAGPAAVKRAAKQRKQAKADTRINKGLKVPDFIEPEEEPVKVPPLEDALPSLVKIAGKAYTSIPEIRHAVRAACESLAGTIGTNYWTGEPAPTSTTEAPPPARDAAVALVKLVRSDSMSNDAVREAVRAFCEAIAGTVGVNYWTTKAPKPAASADKPKVLGVGVRRGYKAINILKTILFDDPDRSKALEIVADWCRQNGAEVSEPANTTGEAPASATTTTAPSLATEATISTTLIALPTNSVPGCADLLWQTFSSEYCIAMARCLVRMKRTQAAVEEPSSSPDPVRPTKDEKDRYRDSVEAESVLSHLVCETQRLAGLNPCDDDADYLLPDARKAAADVATFISNIGGKRGRGFGPKTIATITSAIDELAAMVDRPQFQLSPITLRGKVGELKEVLAKAAGTDGKTAA